jgi:hypothetical protein
MLKAAVDDWNDMIDLLEAERQSGSFSPGMEDAITRMSDLVGRGLRWFDNELHGLFEDPSKEQFLEALKMFGASTEEGEAEWERKSAYFTPRNEGGHDVEDTSIVAIAGPGAGGGGTKTVIDSGTTQEDPSGLLSLEALWNHGGGGGD